ncbi:hypothetical protein SAMN04487895_11876 [Paenibacillus sophorae]|uniref:Uncharacterized protein n=1 Tax=Paenibacillus sophorae TaxID=1333845 RepID=A0A1H8UNQ3_9BACL|nr:hypothetical protein [Paenibacillus sophorae]SEP04845.1 hypothetical protein SAMN04487895_11876 [Paenibacillus sophorae]
MKTKKKIAAVMAGLMIVGEAGSTFAADTAAGSKLSAPTTAGDSSPVKRLRYSTGSIRESSAAQASGSQLPKWSSKATEAASRR